MASSSWTSSTFGVPPPRKKSQELSNWSNLPSDLTSSILLRLDAVDILENARKVCTSWRRVCNEPSMWRKIDLRNPDWMNYDIEAICCHAVDRSEGGLLEIIMMNFVTDPLLEYIAERSSSLTSLRLIMSSSLTDKGFVKAVAKLPFLEELELEVSRTYLKLDLKAIGLSCPRMKTLKLTYSSYTEIKRKRKDNDALAIAESMPELRHLQLIWNKLTDKGLKAILDNCSHLEHLYLRQCLNIKLSGDLEQRCLKMVKGFRRPEDSTRLLSITFVTDS